MAIVGGTFAVPIEITKTAGEKLESELDSGVQYLLRNWLNLCGNFLYALILMIFQSIFCQVLSVTMPASLPLQLAKLIQK